MRAQRSFAWIGSAWAQANQSRSTGRGCHPFYAQLLEGHDLTRETIYRVLEQHYDIPILRGQYRIEAALASAAEAAPLAVTEAAPLLLVERTSLTAGDRTVYYQRRYYRADRVAFDLELARDQARDDSAAEQAAGMPLREFEPVFKKPPPGR